MIGCLFTLDPQEHLTDKVERKMIGAKEKHVVDVVKKDKHVV